MKNTTLSEQFQNPIEKIIERNKIDTPNIQIHDGIFSWLGTGTSINCDGVRLVVRTQISLLSEMTQECKRFPHVSKMPTTVFLEVCNRLKNTRRCLSYN
jgi:hypothetical protein